MTRTRSHPAHAAHSARAALALAAALSSAACQWLRGFEDFSGPVTGTPSLSQADGGETNSAGSGTAGEAASAGDASAAGAAGQDSSGGVAGSPDAELLMAGAGGGSSGSAGSSGSDGSGSTAGSGGGPIMIPPLAIDDFEDGDTFPTSGAFAQWQCYAWGPIQQAFGCDLRAPGYNSNFAQFLIFELTDPANGSQDLPGSGLRSVVKVGTLDLSSYVRVVFSALLEPQPPAGLPTSTLVNVRLGCSSAASGFPPPGGFAVFAPITPLTTWSTLSIKLADFKPGTGGSPLDPSACLELVDGLDFQLVPQQPDDSVAMARFSIDTVYFQ